MGIVSNSELIPGVEIIQDLTGSYALQNCIDILKIGAIILFLSILLSILVIVMTDSKRKYAIITLPILITIFTVSIFTINYSMQSESKIYKVIVSKEADKEDFAKLCIVLEDTGSTKIVEVVQED